MRIERCGSYRNCGTSRIETSTHVQWDAAVQGVKLSAAVVSDFNTDATHDYELWLGSGELARILVAAAVAAERGHAAGLVESLTAHLPTLLRLAGSGTRPGKGAA